MYTLLSFLHFILYIYNGECSYGSHEEVWRKQHSVLLKDPDCRTGMHHSNLELFIHHTTALPPEPLPVQSVPRRVLLTTASLDSIPQ